jgi:hypothetical protein
MPVFAHPLFLFGALTAGIPVALHLMNRQLPRRLRFPSIRFLRTARLPREGRRRLRDLLILALRVLALICIAVALARPQRPAPQSAVGSGKSRQAVIVLDASASMSGFGSAEHAVQEIQELLKGLPKTTRVGLLVSARETLLRLPLDTDRAALRRALADYAPTNEAGAHQNALREAAKMLTEPGGLLVLASDFQRSDWHVTEALSLPPETEVRFLQAAPEARTNSGIIDVDTVPLGADTKRVVVTVRNFAAAPDRRQVEIADAAAKQTRTVEVPPLQNRRVAFVVRQQQGELTVRLNPDDYPADDSFHAWAGSRPPMPILAVTSPEQEPASRDAALFLRKALELRDERSPVQFRVTDVEETFFFTRKLGDTRLIVVLGAGGNFQDAEYGKIQEFLNNGGVVLWTPGDSAPRTFQQLWRRGILRARFLGMAGENGSDIYGLGWVNPETALGRVFARPENTDLFLFPVRRYVRFEPPANATVWLRFLNGDPALIDAPSGRGRVFASALPFSVTWSDLPLTQSFLPLVRELAMAAVPPGYGIRNIECGVPFTDALAKDAKPLDTSRPRALVYGEQPVQINVSRRESILDQANLYDLNRQLTTGDPDSLTAQLAGGPTPAAADELWVWPAGLAALLVLCELLLAHRLDQRELAGRVAPAPQES